MDMKNDKLASKKATNDFSEMEMDAFIQEALKTDSFISIPDDFADKLEKKANRLNKQRYWLEEFFKQFILWTGTMIILVVAIGIVWYYKPENAWTYISFLLDFKWILIIGFAFLFFIQLADSWLMKKLNLS
jgi:magnesium-transporting ATPase (P-type)